MLLNRSVKSARRLSVGRNASTAVEIKIPSPFGYIAGKWWGPTNKRPVLCLHGWQDNSASFDPLIPLLPSNMSYLAIDIPGHGLSSRLPPGVFYHQINNVFTIKTIKDYFGWNKIALMGHSLGAILAYTYGFILPQEVDFMVCLDAVHPIVHKTPIDRAIRSIKEFEIYSRHAAFKTEPPSFTMQELCEKLHHASFKSIDLQKCGLMLQRNTAPSKLHPGKYYVTRDPRVKTGFMLTWTRDVLLEAATRVTFPILINRSAGMPVHTNKAQFKEYLDILKQHSSDFEYHRTAGTHHVHFNQPELLQGILYPFLEKQLHKEIEMNEINKDIIMA